MFNVLSILPGLLAGFFILFVLTGTASAHTPDWVSRLLEWTFGKKAMVGETPSAGWMEPKLVLDFRLVDQHGREITLHDLQGKVVLISFMYTECGDSCPSIKELKILAKALGKRMESKVLFVSITLAPEQDTSEILKTFGQKEGIGPGWKFLTGPSEAIEKLADAYGVYVRRIKVNHNSEKHYQTIEYGDVVLFLDQEGKLRKRVLPHLLRLSGRKDVEWLLEGHDHD
jgi:cytochrome oxidase Cu insertion factor (SCO1/SenC/PrrC family)